MSHFWEGHVWDESKTSQSRAWTWTKVWKEWTSEMLIFLCNRASLKSWIHINLCIYASSCTRCICKPWQPTWDWVLCQTFPICNSRCICWYIYSKMAGCIMWVFLPDYRYKTKTPNHRLPPPLSSMITCSKDPMTKCTAQLFRLF